MIDRSFLKETAAAYDIPLSEEVLEKLDVYASLLVEWNEKMNLTAILKPEEIAIKHFLDSLLAARFLSVSRETSLIDVGTGAGFPGLPLKLYLPQLNLTLLDSLNKRLTFLQAVAQETGAEAALVHARAEDGGRKPELRGRFDYATARAVAHLRELCEYCLPFVKVGGSFLALKGGNVEEELSQSERAISALGGRLEAVHKLELPGGDARTVIEIRKISQTTSQYPRPSAKIAKNPLV